MKSTFFLSFVLILVTKGFLLAQHQKAEAEINPEDYTVFNRELSYEEGTIYLNAEAKDGLLWLNHPDFKNGTIELDIKGRNAPGKSFVGIAFHGLNNQKFDAVYFRPFNFKHPDRNKHSVQYISMPGHDWASLRQAYPAKYENAINPVPEQEDDWFHAKIVVNYPQVKVYINGSKEPSLEVEQLSDTRQGKVGFWVGNYSDGWFRNLKITAHHP
jgi:hypothetical protein